MTWHTIFFLLNDNVAAAACGNRFTQRGHRQGPRASWRRRIFVFTNKCCCNHKNIQNLFFCLSNISLSNIFCYIFGYIAHPYVVVFLKKKKKSLKADGRMRCSFLRCLIGPYIIASPCMNGTLDSLTLWQENRVAGRSPWMFKKQPAISGSVKTRQSRGPFHSQHTR